MFLPVARGMHCSTAEDDSGQVMFMAFSETLSGPAHGGVSMQALPKDLLYYYNQICWSVCSRLKEPVISVCSTSLNVSCIRATW